MNIIVKPYKKLIKDFKKSKLSLDEVRKILNALEVPENLKKAEKIGFLKSTWKLIFGDYRLFCYIKGNIIVPYAYRKRGTAYKQENSLRDVEKRVENTF
ncbi:MAG: hypothetical protein Q8R00_02395 [Candidatus Nanoarchaeia archaeon]|nr:hypothetical protein [Candidatus Nanoarchaeia archaeon]